MTEFMLNDLNFLSGTDHLLLSRENKGRSLVECLAMKTRLRVIAAGNRKGSQLEQDKGFGVRQEAQDS